MPKQELKPLQTANTQDHINKQVEEAMQKNKFNEQKKQFEAKIEELANRAAEFYEKYGEEDWRTSLLVNFLDMSLQMQDIIEVIQSFNIANEIIFGALGLMNTSLEMSNGFMIDLATQQQPTWKRKMMYRKALRNNRRTVKAMVDQMMVSIEMASLTAGMYEGLSVSIASMMDKMNGKRAKQKAKAEKKAGEGGSNSMGNGRGLDLVKKKITEQGGTVSPSSGSSSAPSAPAGGSTGIDDIL